MPGPLSLTVMRKRLAWLAGGGGPPLAATSSLTTMSGRIPASSHASSALSTASLTQVNRALRGLSKPRRCRFFVKNSETEISRWRAPISTAETVGFAGAGGGVGFGAVSVRARAAIWVQYKQILRRCPSFSGAAGDAGEGLDEAV